jgi:exosortase K
LLALVGAYALKLAYSQAGAAQLEWVLAPSCWLASRLGGLRLIAESGAGWISHDPRMVVGPACAGVNFLIVAWLALYFGCHEAGRAPRRKLAWLFGSLAVAYLATVATNGVRIVLAARLFAADFYAGWTDREGAHRLLGVVLYCTVLPLLCAAAQASFGLRDATRSLAARLVPFYWYLAVVLGVPLLNRAFLRDPARFAEHAALTAGVGFAVVLVAGLFGLGVDRLRSRRIRA